MPQSNRFIVYFSILSEMAYCIDGLVPACQSDIFLGILKTYGLTLKIFVQDIHHYEITCKANVSVCKLQGQSGLSMVMLFL